MKFTILMIALAPLCCSDICAYMYESVMRNLTPTVAQTGVVARGVKSLPRFKSRSGCSCHSRPPRFRNYDEEEEYYDYEYYGGGY